MRVLSDPASMVAWFRRSLGAQLAFGASITAGLSLPFVQPSGQDLLRLAPLTVAGIVMVAALTGRRGAADHTRLAAAVVVLTGLALTSVLTDGLSTTFTGMITLVFVFVGLTCPPSSTLLLLPVAVTSWLVINTPLDHQVLARLPVVFGVWLIIGEVLSRQKAEATALRVELTLEAEQDPLTGLFNRNGLSERLAVLRDRDAVVFLDLDHFKRVNDLFGHAVGDAVLRDLGRVVLSVLRPGDTAIRYGGEEIVLLLPGAGSTGAERVLGRLKAGWGASHPELTFSAGVAVVGVVDGAGAVLQADLSLYAAKAAGRNCWTHSSIATDDQTPTPFTTTPQIVALPVS